MHLRTVRRGRNLVAAAATLGLLGLPLLTSPAEAAPGKPKAPAIKVMTRNLYLGADILRPIQALGKAQAEHPGDQLAQLNAFANANDITHDIVMATNFPARAEMLAAEISSAKPDLVGLQEVALWRTGLMDSPLGADFLARNATEVQYDFLENLLDELAEDGVAYEAISVGKRADVEGPAYEGNFGTQQQADSDRDVRLTMRDVIIRRVDSKVTRVKGKGTKGNKIYAENLSFDLDNNAETDNSITFSRGYQWVDMQKGKYRFRMLTTHLEAFGSDLAYAQAQELVDGAGGYDGTAVLTCDCNSDPALGTTKPGEDKRHWAPYFLIKRQGGFNDTWEQWDDPSAGFTSGLSETVMDDSAAGFDHRIDMVFARTAKGDKLPVLNGDVTGDELEDRDTETGLWPSDHAGVVMKLRLR
jgi:endonuclease/exonuclease/phosphatase family metal-dependent hydrolase